MHSSQAKKYLRHMIVTGTNHQLDILASKIGELVLASPNTDEIVDGLWHTESDALSRALEGTAGFQAWKEADDRK